MIKGLIPATLALWAGAVCADDVMLLNDSITLTLPPAFSVTRSFGEDTKDGIYAVELGAQSVEALWAQNNRAAENPDMDRMEAAFGLTFPSANCADYPPNAQVLPTRCKQAIEMSVLVIPKDWPDAGARLGNQMGLLSDDVIASWNAGDLETLLTSFCTNAQHPHRKEIARTAEQITCISDRPALAPHFLSFRLMLTPDTATIIYAQNIAAETDVIMTYGVDDFLALVEGARDIETTLLAATQSYVAEQNFDNLYMLSLFDQIQVSQ